MATRNPSLNIRPDVARTVAGKNATEDALHGPRPSSWWTGKHPTQCPGFDPKDGVLRSLPLPNLSNFTRQSVLDYFDNCWTQTEVRSSNAIGWHPHAHRTRASTKPPTSCQEMQHQSDGASSTPDAWHAAHGIVICRTALPLLMMYHQALPRSQQL